MISKGCCTSVGRRIRYWVCVSVAEERLLAMSTSPNAWSPVYEAAADTDDSRVPQVAESLLTLIAGITGPSRMFFLVLVFFIVVNQPS